MSNSTWFHEQQWRVPFGVSDHARQRYLERVCADTPLGIVTYMIQRMWRQSQAASDGDIALAHAQRRRGNVYRVGVAANGLRFLMIARENVIVTILEMR